jgi:FlaA1/EpsC-like NDP-sugar epimerase
MLKPASPSARSTSDPRTSGVSWEVLLDSATRGWTVPGSEQLAGKRVLITGAGGSIGSALTLAVQASKPSSLVLLDTSENGLYQIDRSLREAGSQQHVSILGSVCDGPTLEHAFEQRRPQIVVHAAALKHVPLMEQNPFAAVTNNTLGTLALTQTAVRHDVERLVLVSTDKAVDPISIMGASKRIAELVLLANAPCSTRLTAVRLCNVLGSQGSVLPLFLDQLARNVALTVTHPDAERYFITLDRAVDSIFAALETNESPCLLIPNPGPPLRILDLAQHLLNEHRSSSSITFTGLRSGDKLSERLHSAGEHLLPSEEVYDTGLRVAVSPAPALGLLESTLEELRAATQTHDLAGLLRAIHVLVPEYEPSNIIRGALTTSASLELTQEAHA